MITPRQKGAEARQYGAEITECPFYEVHDCNEWAAGWRGTFRAEWAT